MEKLPSWKEKAKKMVQSGVYNVGEKAHSII